MKRTLPHRPPPGSAMALGGTAVFVAVVAGLHFMQSDYAPATQLISELAIGKYGWAMLAAFCGLAVATLGVAVSAENLQASLWMRVLLLVAAVCFFLAGAFPLDRSAEIHITAIALGFVDIVLAMYLFPVLAAGAMSYLPRWFCWSCGGASVMFVALGHGMLPMGIAQRLAVTGILIWLTGVGWRLRNTDTRLKPPSAGGKGGN